MFVPSIIWLHNITKHFASLTCLFYKKVYCLCFKKANIYNKMLMNIFNSLLGDPLNNTRLQNDLVNVSGV